ncbi:Acyl-coA synthetase, putative [Hondaea fermentalgiana]|uniref:Acyl-coA synthetase, putative n=1 Tax=Hondaea fermentalgiana TaxID=2315210 RepID=A0A2R5GP53_9STRA|nr:Acyl-coA synthetase, putative [Hondaea fermentalgiana]|eukprot:GBG32652.1 Acyl-coA synthetase, putative [Hondaea fermentalgiana]
MMSRGPFEDAIAEKVFAPGTLLELREEVIAFPDKHAPHHEGVKYKVFPNAPQTLVDVFEIPKAKGVMENEFLVFEDDRRTFTQVYAEAAALGDVLVNGFGVQRGDRVCAVSKNRIEYLVAFIAVTSVGACFVPMNSWWKTKELEYGLENSGTKVVICDADRYKFLEPILDKLDTVEKVLLLNGPGTDAFAPHAKRIAYDDAVAKHQGATMPPFTASKDENALIMYTSGTTGHPKGVVMTHRSICHALFSAIAHAVLNKTVAAVKAGITPTAEEPTPEELSKAGVLLNVPLFHATGLHAVCMISIVTCRKIVMMSKWNPERALQLVERERITAFTGVPTMVLDMMNHPNFSKYDTSSLEAVGGGGAAPPSTITKDIGKNFKNAAPTQGFGMTETNALSVLTDGDAYCAKPTSCGRAVPTLLLAIWDDNDKPVPTGQKGNVMVKSASVMKEYWRKPEATADTITRDGWLRTGDVGHLDEEGYLYLGGRTKEIIIRGGENISCVTVEDGVYQHPGVAECAAIPVPHPSLGEEVGIVVFPKNGAKLTLEEIVAKCSDLAKFECPTHLYLWPEQLPRGATGKIVKRDIRQIIEDKKLLSEQQKQAPASKL